MLFPDVSEVIRAYDNKEVELTTRITVRIVEFPKNAATEEFERTVTRYETTVGRAILSEILPKGLPFSVLNRALKKKEISKLINTSFRKCGLRATVVFADKLMQSGFRLATRASGDQTRCVLLLDLFHFGFSRADLRDFLRWYQHVVP